MFVFAIETNGRTVAFTKVVDRVMLDGVLNGKSAEGEHLRDGAYYLQWDRVSPFTARLATDSEDAEYHVTFPEDRKLKSEDFMEGGILSGFTIIDKGRHDSVLLIPPTTLFAA